MFKFGAKAKTVEPAQKTSVQPEAGAPASAPVSAPAPAVASAAPQAISARAATLISGLYQMIFSAELGSGVYQLESGSFASCGMNMPLRGYYDALYTELCARVAPECAERFAELFSRQNLYAQLLDGRSSISEAFCINLAAQPAAPGQADAAASGQADAAAAPVQAAAPNFRWVTLEAMRLGTPANGRMRCFILVRTVQSGKDNGHVPEQKVEVLPDENTSERERLRTQKLLGGTRVMFFEYNVADDTLLLHRDPGNPKADRVLKRYLASIEEMCDWTIFHEDVLACRSLMRKGEGSMELRYRTGGDHAAPFRWHLLRCAPMEENGKLVQVLGALTDIDDEVKLRANTRRLTVQMSALMDTAFSYVAEIDTLKGITTRLSITADGYEKEKSVHKLREFILEDIKNGVVHPDDADEYRKWLQPGYLAKAAAGKAPYTFETRLRLPGKTEYGWYTENVSCPDPKMPYYFIRMRRNITELHDQREKNAELQQQVRFAEYNQTVIDSLSSLVEFRDVESGEHVQRVRGLTQLILESLRASGAQPGLTKQDINRICSAAAMHDVGKIAIPDLILNKPGRLTPEEFEIMKTHTTKGAAIIDKLDLTGSEELRACCRDIALHHHERYDGKGYPEHLEGEAISIAAQVVGLADAYDALVSVRCYKKSFSHETALRMLQNGECGAFSPSALNALTACAEACRRCYLPAEPTQE